MSKKDKVSALDAYQLDVHRFGRISSVIIGVIFLAVPAALTVFTGIKVDMGKTIQGAIGILSLMGVMSIVEFLSYSPILGSSLYLSFITGNTVNMKLPAAISSMKLANVEPGSKEGQVISMIAVGVSAMTTTIILIIGMLAMSLLVPVLQNPVLKPGFDNLMPALLGAMAIPMILKDRGSMRTASIPLVIAIVVAVVLGAGSFMRYQSMLIPVFMLITVGWARILYNRDQKNKGAASTD